MKLPFACIVVSCLAVGYLSAFACSTPLPPREASVPVDDTASIAPDETLPDVADAAYEVNTGPCPGTCCPGSCGINGTSGDYGKAGGLGNVLR
jgi:hypothetical protein